MLCFTLYDVVSGWGLVHFLKPMLPTDNVFLQNKLFKKCFEIHHATLCETNHGFHAMSLLTLSTFSSFSLVLTNISATSIFLKNTSLVLKRLQYLQ